MKNNQHNSIFNYIVSSKQKIFLFGFILLMIPVFFVSRTIMIGFAQTKDKNEKIITKESFKNEPIEIVELKSNEKIVEFNQQFVQKDDWLKDFTIKFKNVSGKPIVYVSTVIGFPETNTSGYRKIYFLKYGINPLVKKTENDKLELLTPNGLAELKLSAEKFSNLKNFLIDRSMLSDLTQVHITVMAVYFEDGTHWSAGTMFRPDPNRPGKFIAVEDKNQGEE